MRTLLLENGESVNACPSLRILLLEQDPFDAGMILQELRQAGLAIDSVIVGNRSTFETALRSGDFAAVLVDDGPPDWNGLPALQWLRDSGKDIPFLLVTGSLDEEVAAGYIRHGLDDYVWKDRLWRLPVALKRALEEKQLRAAYQGVQSVPAVSEAPGCELIDRCIYGIFRVSPDGLFIKANSTLQRLLACESLGELKTLNLATDVFRYPEHYAQLLASCRDRGLVHNAESEWRRKDGGLLIMRLHLRYLSMPGPADAMEGIVEDITELRALEHQLHQAQKFETIGELAGGIAHDFNNVVGAILGWAEIGYEQSRASPAIAERFARIREQADRAAALTRELLAFARCQSLQPCPVDLNVLTHNLTSFLEKVIGNNIEIKLKPGTLQPVKADPTQLEQVLMNLCLNARDAMPEGGRLLIETEMVQLDDSYCSLYPHVIPGSYAVLSVADTGVGMDAKIRDHIFEPFFTTKERGKGSGMGLATVYGIVNQHNGFLHVYSEPGQGSLFRVYLPAMDGAAVERTSPGPEASRLANLCGSETILFAEDHESIREMVRQALLNLGYRVLAADDGEQALRLCEKERPTLAILDLVMPHLGGPATAAKLLARFPDLPILFTSGYSECSDSFATQFPGSRYLQKPYSPTSLGRAIREILDG